MDGRSGSFAVFAWAESKKPAVGEKLNDGVLLEVKGMGINMILPEGNYMDVNRVWRGRESASGGGRNDGVRRGSEFSFKMPEPRREEAERDYGTVSAEEEFYKNQGESRLISMASQEGKELGREELLKLLADHREEILKKVKSGETGVKIAIGSMRLTQEEWEKLLDSIDEAQEKIRENADKESDGLPEKRTDTTVNGDKLFAAEDTGHDLKALEELIGEITIKGKDTDTPDERDLLTDEEEQI